MEIQHNPETKKGQSGIEQLASYGWVVFIGVGALVLLYLAGQFRPAPCEKNTFGFSGVVPVDWEVYRDSGNMVAKVEGGVGEPVIVRNATANIGDLQCFLKSPVVIEPGTEVFLELECPGPPGIPERFEKGDCYKSDLEIVYYNTVAGSYADSKGVVRGSIAEGSFIPPTTAPTSTSTTTTSTTATTTTTSTTTTTTLYTTTSTSSTSSSTTTSTTTTKKPTTTTTTTTKHTTTTSHFPCDPGQCCDIGSKICRVSCGIAGRTNYCGTTIEDCWSDAWSLFIDYSDADGYHSERIAPCANPICMHC